MQSTKENEPGSRPIPFQANGLYIVLSNLDDAVRWHWMLYLAFSPKSGHKFHGLDIKTVLGGLELVGPGGVIQDTLVYEGADTDELALDDAVVVAIKFASLDPDEMHQPFVERVDDIKVRDGDTSRKWLLGALRQLEQEGWFTLRGSVEDLEQEARDVAFDHGVRKRRDAVQSKLFVPTDLE